MVELQLHELALHNKLDQIFFSSGEASGGRVIDIPCRLSLCRHRRTRYWKFADAQTCRISSLFNFFFFSRKFQLMFHNSKITSSALFSSLFTSSATCSVRVDRDVNTEQGTFSPLILLGTNETIRAFISRCCSRATRPSITEAHNN